MSTAEISGVWPGLTFELAFGTTADTAASSFTDVSAYVREWGMTIGRQRRLDEFQAGTMYWVLDNRDRRFDPLYSAGPYFGDLLPMVQGRMRALWSAVTYDLAFMYTDGWPQSYEPPAGMDSTVTLTFTDGFLILGRTPLKSVWHYTVAGLSPTRWYPLGEQSGTKMGDISGNGAHGVYVAGATFNHRDSLVPYGDGGSIEFNGTDMSGKAAYLDSTDSTVAFWAKMPDTLLEDGVTYTSLVHQDAGDAPASNNPRRWDFAVSPGDVGSSTPARHLMYVNAEATAAANPLYSDAQMVAGRVYFIVATYNGTTPILYVNGTAQTNDGPGVSIFDTLTSSSLLVGGQTTISGPLTLASWAAPLGDVALWDSVLTANNIADLFEAGDAPWDGDAPGTRIGNVLDEISWPASLRDLDAGSSVLGPARLEGSALDYLQLVAATEGGLLYMDGTGRVTLVGRGNQLTESRFTTSQGTFGDGSGEIPYTDIVTSGYDVVSIVNGARVGRQGGVLQEYLDATSAAAYGPAYAPDETGLLMATDGAAYDRAVAKVLARKDPQFRVDSITINPRSAPSTAFPQVLGRKLGDRVTVKRRPGNPAVGSTITQECHIEGITHRVTPLEWETTWALSAVDPNEDGYFLMGVALVGSSNAHVGS